VPPSSYAWEDAKTYCAALDLSGAGWRLPNVKELQTIVDETRADPAIDETAFPSTPSELFWTSSPVAGNANYAWNVYFNYGDSNADGVLYTGRVRCVR
jgi:hypothetical protein